MNSLLLLFADGITFFVGHAIVAVAPLLCFVFRNRVATAVMTIAMFLGWGCIALSAVPLPMWTAVLYSATSVLALLFSVVEPYRHRAFRLRVAAVGTTIVLSVAMCLAELPYHRAPQITVRRDQTIYVIGDSISAGLWEGERTWPDVLAETSGLSVVNLAAPGATVTSALTQADWIAERDSLVVLEIGGNDLLGNTSADEFATHLDDLLATTTPRTDQVVMFELPLPPHRAAFGAAQRVLARKHGVTLIPKRVLANVLGMRNGTIDGIHLSQTGHDALARRVRDILTVE